MDSRFPAPTLRRVWALYAAVLFQVPGTVAAQGAAGIGPEHSAPAEAATDDGPEARTGAAPSSGHQPSSGAVGSTDPSSDAEAHLRRGLELYGQKHYTQAVAEFRAGYAINADERLLYALAQSLRLAGQCEEAVVLYRRFLESAPSPAQEAAARANLERCGDKGTRPSAEPGPEIAPNAAQPAPSNRQASARPATDVRRLEPPTDRTLAPRRAPLPEPQVAAMRPAWSTDVLGATLTGGGLLCLGAGVTLLVSANAEHVDLERRKNGATPGTYQEHADRIESGERKTFVGGVLTAAGVVAIALGIVRYHGVASEDGTDVALTVLPSQGGAVLRGRF